MTIHTKTLHLIYRTNGLRIAPSEIFLNLQIVMPPIPWLLRKLAQGGDVMCGAMELKDHKSKASPTQPAPSGRITKPGPHMHMKVPMRFLHTIPRDAQVSSPSSHSSRSRNNNTKRIMFVW